MSQLCPVVDEAKIVPALTLLKDTHRGVTLPDTSMGHCSQPAGTDNCFLFVSGFSLTNLGFMVMGISPPVVCLPSVFKFQYEQRLLLKQHLWMGTQFFAFF